MPVSGPIIEHGDRTREGEEDPVIQWVWETWSPFLHSPTSQEPALAIRLVTYAAAGHYISLAVLV